VSFLDRDIAENNMLSNGDLSVDPLAIELSCWCDPTFGHFGRTPTCDRQTDRQTDEQTRRQGHGISADSGSVGHGSNGSTSLGGSRGSCNRLTHQPLTDD